METFMLPIEYEGEEMEFETRIAHQGYIYKFVVNVDSKEVVFERDEEGQIRALIDGSSEPMTKKRTEILRAIAENLQRISG